MPEEGMKRNLHTIFVRKSLLAPMKVFSWLKGTVLNYLITKSYKEIFWFLCPVLQLRLRGNIAIFPVNCSNRSSWFLCDASINFLNFYFSGFFKLA